MGGGELPILALDEWALIEVVIDLDNNTHEIFYNSISLFGGVPRTWAALPCADPPGLGKVALECIDLFTGGLGTPPATDFWYDNVEIEVPPSKGQFIRADMSADGIFNALVDALFGLNAGFVPGSPQPPCQEAADADNNGVVNFLADSLYILNVGFVPGTPPPDLPFPGCGANAPGDTVDLGCETPPPSC